MSLAELRKSAGKKQYEVAAELKIKPNTYCQYESGKRILKVQLIEPLALVLNTTVDEVVKCLRAN